MLSRVYCGAQVLCVSLFLTACGGGGGGDPGSSGPALSVSTTSVAFTAIHNESPPASQQVGVSVSGGTVFLAHDQTGSTFTHSFAVNSDQSTGTITVAPLSPTMAPRRTYTGTVTVKGCPTPTCSSDVAGSPAVIKVAYTIDPQVALVASPQSFAFSQFQGGPAPAPQTLALSDVDDGNYAWSASVTYQRGSGWLNINGAGSASGSSLPASLSLSVNPSSALDTLNAVVHFTGKGKPVDVPVSYTVSEPRITPSPAQLTFNATNQGASPPAQDITLSTQGNVPINYTTAVVTYSAGASGWLNVPASGTAPGTLTVGVGTTNLAPGTYTATLNVSTATRTVSIGVTYVVAASSLTLNPSSANFTIDSTSVPAALARSVNVGATGASLNWTAASSQPWVTVSPSSGSSGTTVTLSLVTAQIDSFDPGMRSATVTFSYTPPGGSPASTPLAVSLNLLLPKVSSVTPNVATSGTSMEVILRGLGFNNAGGAAVKFGSGPTVSSYTVASDTEIRVTHPSLTPGSYRVSIANQLDLVRSTADLVVVNAPAYTATTIAYPNATAKAPLNIAYDAQRQALLVGVAYPSAGQSGDIFRYAFSGSAWSATPVSAPVSAFRDIALSLDGAKLIAVSDLGINQLNPATLAAGTSTGAPFSPPLFLSGTALANDGNAVVTTGTQGGGSTNVYRYSVGGGSFSAPIGSLFSAVGGASADGSRAVLVQGGSSPPQNVFEYTAPNSTLSATTLPLTQTLPGPVLDRRATRIVLNGSLVYDANFQQQGKIPASLAIVLSPNGAKAHAYSSGTLLHTYNLNGALDANGFFPEIGTGTALAGDPGSNPVMTVSPDGGTLFIAGAGAIIVVPAP